MLGWLFRRNREPVVFADPAAAFAYACDRLENRLLVNALVPALVEQQGNIGEDGERRFLLRLAARDGGRSVWSCTLNGAGGFPAVGDLVGFRVVRIADELPEPMNVIGYIAARLQPVLVPSRGWRVAENYTPDSLKPELHM